jgi:hypothetical protein
MADKISSEIDIFNVPDPRLDIDKPIKWAIPLGAPQQAFNIYPAQSTNNSQQTIQAQVSAPTTLVDREWRLINDIKVILAGTSTGSNNLVNIGSFDALRRNPIQRNMTQLSLNINGEATSIKPNIFTNNQAWYASDKLQNTELSTSPQFLDRYAEYRDYLDYGAALNSLGAGGDNGYMIPRGAFVPYSTDYNTSTGASMNFLIEEVLEMKPLSSSLQSDKAFSGIENIELDFTFNSSNQQMIWSHATGAGCVSTINSVSWTYNTQPILELTTFRGNPLIALPDPNRKQYFDNLYPNPQSQNFGLVAPGATFGPTTQTLSLLSIPDFFLLMSKEDPSSESCISTDTCAWVNQLQLTFMEAQALLNNATPRDLYRMARKNGYKGNWKDWSQFSGSPLIIRMGEDVPLPVGEASSLGGKWQIQLTQSTFTSLYRTRTVNFTLYMIPYYSGVYTIAYGQAQAKSSILTAENIAKSGKLPMVDKIELTAEALAGGDFFSNFKSFFTRTLPSIYRKTKETIPKVLNEVESFVPYVKQGEKIYSELASLRGKHGGVVRRPRHHRRMVGHGLGACGECNHVECEGEGGCVACDNMENTIPEGRLNGENLRSRLVGNGLVINDNDKSGFSRSNKKTVKYIEQYI